CVTSWPGSKAPDPRSLAPTWVDARRLAPSEARPNVQRPSRTRQPPESGVALPDSLATQGVAPMRLLQVQLRPKRHHAGRVDGRVALVVVALDVLEVHRFRDARPLVQLAQPAAQARVIGDAPQVALEMPVVDGVETNQRGE